MGLSMQVHIDEHVYQKIMYWINKAGKNEVSGLGSVMYDPEDHVMRVTEAYLLKQENGPSSTDIDPDAIGELEYEHYVSGNEGDIRFWWHSHVDMSVFWSKTDEDTIEELGQHGWFVNTVFNKREEMKTCIYMTDPMKIFADDLDTSIVRPVSTDAINEALGSIGLQVSDKKLNQLLWSVESKIDPAERKQWEDEFKEKVSVKRYQYSYGYGYGRQQGTNSRTSHSTQTSLPPSKETESGSRVYNGIPDYEPKGAITHYHWPSYLFNEDGKPDPDMSKHELVEDVIDLVAMNPDMTKRDIIDFYEDEYPDIESVVYSLFSREESN